MFDRIKTTTSNYTPLKEKYFRSFNVKIFYYRLKPISLVNFNASPIITLQQHVRSFAVSLIKYVAKNVFNYANSRSSVDYSRLPVDISANTTVPP